MSVVFRLVAAAWFSACAFAQFDTAAVLGTVRDPSGALIGNMPLNGRNYSDLALLSAGVQRSLLSVAGDPREGSFNVNGLPSSQNNFILDGVDNNAYGTSNQGFSNQVSQVSPDALQE